MLARFIWAVVFGVMTASAGMAEVTVFAASSMKTVLDRIIAGQDVRVSYAGSAALARQIIQGAPADLFISASPEWMDAVEADGLVTARQDLLSNRLVLVSYDPAPPVDLRKFDILAALKGGKLAMGLVEAVPAGIYGKAALESLGQWEALAPHVAQVDNVRNALALVSSGAAPMGVVYATDAMAAPDIHVVGLFPKDSHPKIIYPVATLNDRPTTLAVLELLNSYKARKVFRAGGFEVLE